MKYFLDTVETIPEGLGFSHFDTTHFIWIAICAVTIAVNCLLYRRLGEKGRKNWKRIVALLIIGDELFKMVMLTIGGRYQVDYLPLHLCSINIFVIACHAWRPNRTIGGFLYTVCIPGAIAALLFPTWTSLPAGNFMHLHSFTIHILLIMYPMVLAICGETKPQARQIPKYLALLAGLALVALAANLLLDTNFMFLMYAEPGNPLYVFEQLWGSHLLGFPVLITAVLIVMYVPMGIYRRLRKQGNR